jgi:carboxyl-terminal processing protease
MTFSSRIYLPVCAAILALVTHSSAMAAAVSPFEEFRLIADAFALIKSDHADDVAEATIATGCREGIVGVMSETAPGLQLANNLPVFEKNSLPETASLIRYFMEQQPAYVTQRKLIDGCLHGMMKAVDPHSAYIAPKEVKELREVSGSKFVGIGLELGMEDGYAKIITPIADGPGHRAGLLPGDLILRIDGVAPTGMSLGEIVKLMRGPAGSVMNLTIARKNFDKPIAFEIRREVIRVTSVSSKVLMEKYLYIRIRNLAQNTVELLGAALKDSPAFGLDRMAGIVLDLRSNPGGVLPSMIGVPAAFLPPSSLIVSTVGRTKDANARFYAKPEFYGSRANQDPLRDLPPAVKTLPLLVLIDRKSASGAELIAASLQDYRRAKIVGERTLGYGTVQTIRLLDNDTAIKITTGRLLRPSGKPIDRQGVTPDYVSNMAGGKDVEFGSKEDTALGEALKLFEEK